MCSCGCLPLGRVVAAAACPQPSAPLPHPSPPPPPFRPPSSLWLLPHAFSLLGWIPAIVAVTGIALTTVYSGSLFTRLFLAAPGTVLFGDIAEAAAGPTARALCYAIGGSGRLVWSWESGRALRLNPEGAKRPVLVPAAAAAAAAVAADQAPPLHAPARPRRPAVYTLDGTRCVILHLAATQSLEHALGDHAPPLWQCGLIVLVLAAVAAQIRALSELSGFFLLGTSAQVRAEAGAAGLGWFSAACRGLGFVRLVVCRS
jgi:hypothetical protein